jgi:hypothetical protein
MNTTNIKDVNINFKKGWDPRRQSIILSYDANSKIGFCVKMVPVYQDDSVIEDTEEANEILRKFTK